MKTSPTAAAAARRLGRLVRIMSSSPSEGERRPDPEQMGRELVRTGIAAACVHEPAPVVLSDVLVTEVHVELGCEIDAGAERELVACGFGQERRHELRRRGRGVMQIAATQLQLRRVLVLGAEAEPVRVLAAWMERNGGRQWVLESDEKRADPPPPAVLVIRH